MIRGRLDSSADGMIRGYVSNVSVGLFVLCDFLGENVAVDCIA